VCVKLEHSINIPCLSCTSRRFSYYNVNFYSRMYEVNIIDQFYTISMGLNEDEWNS
jgi:hypothetical protein